MSIYKGDDTQAFGGSFLTINLEGSEEFIISKAIWRSGSIVKEIQNPEFPITINLTSEETSKLAQDNVCYLAVFDANGLKKTCEGSFRFCAKVRVV